MLIEDVPIAHGTRQDDQSVTASLEFAREGLSEQLELFAQNTMEYMLRERDLLLDGIGSPEVRTRMDGRPVLIVVRGYHYKEDLATLKPFLRENRPIIIGVDGGADAVIEAGFHADMIIGDMDSVSDRALRSGSELVVHASAMDAPPVWNGWPSWAWTRTRSPSPPPAPARTSRCC